MKGVTVQVLRYRTYRTFSRQALYRICRQPNAVGLTSPQIEVGFRRESRLKFVGECAPLS